MPESSWINLKTFLSNILTNLDGWKNTVTWCHMALWTSQIQEHSHWAPQSPTNPGFMLASYLDFIPWLHTWASSSSPWPLAVKHLSRTRPQTRLSGRWIRSSVKRTSWQNTSKYVKCISICWILKTLDNIWTFEVEGHNHELVFAECFFWRLLDFRY